MVALAFYQEHEVERKEPLQPRTTILKLDFFWASVIRHPDAEVIAVRFESKTVVALFPPRLEFLRQSRASGLQQDGALPLALNNLCDFICSGLSILIVRVLKVATKLKDLFGLKADEAKQHTKGSSLRRFLRAQILPLKVLDHMREIYLRVQIPIVGVVNKLGQIFQDKISNTFDVFGCRRRDLGPPFGQDVKRLLHAWNDGRCLGGLVWQQPPQRRDGGVEIVRNPILANGLDQSTSGVNDRRFEGVFALERLCLLNIRH